MRVVAVVLAVLLSTSPLLRAASNSHAPEPCPMAASDADGPCLMAPCPCDHSSQGAVPPNASPALVESLGAMTRAERPCLSSPVAPLAVSPGHPFPIDHPPSTRA